MNKKIISLLLIVVVLLTFGCGKKQDSDIKKIKKEKKEISIVNLKSNSRPYAVVVNNFPDAVKVQTGLQDAYMVYEIPVEGGMTRSLAFYKDKENTKIGTIRSARHNFLDYVLENDAIFVHFGWSFYAKEQIPQLGINNINGLSDAPFWRENPEGLATEHTAYTSLDKIKEEATRKNYRQTTDQKVLLNYSTKKIDLSKKEDSIVANSIELPYSYSYGVRFDYDKQNKNYKRYVNEVEHTDYFTKESFTATNIIIIKLDYGYASNRYYLDIYNIGSGEGYYITKGYAVPIEWSKKDRSSKTIYKYKNGKEISVNDGNTYIMLHPINQELKIS